MDQRRIYSIDQIAWLPVVKDPRAPWFALAALLLFVFTLLLIGSVGSLSEAEVRLLESLML